MQHLELLQRLFPIFQIITTLIVPLKKEGRKISKTLSFLSVLPSIAALGNLAYDPLREKTETGKNGRVKTFSRSDAPSELLIQGGGVQDLDPTEESVFENP